MPVTFFIFKRVVRLKIHVKMERKAKHHLDNYYINVLYATLPSNFRLFLDITKSVFEFSPMASLSTTNFTLFFSVKTS